MGKHKDITELAIKFLLRPVTGKAGLALTLGGLLLISPPFWVDLLNLVLGKTNLGTLPLPKVELSPGWGVVLALLGAFLVALNHVWVPRQNAREVIGIRHNSLGSFPRNDVQRDLPVVQRLYHYREIDVDHSDSYEDGILNDHKSITRRLEQVPHELNGLLRSNPDTPIAYYGLPHVPLAFYLGYLLSDNKYNITPYELNNTSKRWDQLSGLESSLQTTNNVEQLAASTDKGDVILTIGISYPIHPSEIDELNLTNVLGHVSLKADLPQRQLIQNQSQIDQLCKEFQRTLEHIKNTFPNRQRIHLFYAGPASLCFALGQNVSERIDPTIQVYNYSAQEHPKYAWSLEINAPNSTAQFIRHSSEGEENDSVQYA